LWDIILKFANSNKNDRFDFYFRCHICKSETSMYSNSLFYNTNLSVKQIILIYWSILKYFYVKLVKYIVPIYVTLIEIMDIKLLLRQFITTFIRLKI
jgi:hypothetical protein